MARVTPTPEAIQNRAEWEFYAGGHGAAAKWVKGDVAAAVPLIRWPNHTGVVTMSFVPALAGSRPPPPLFLPNPYEKQRQNKCVV